MCVIALATPDIGTDSACRTMVTMRLPARRPLLGLLGGCILLAAVLPASPASARPALHLAIDWTVTQPSRPVFCITVPVERKRFITAMAPDEKAVA